MSEFLDLLVNNEEKLKLLKKEQSKKEPKKLKRKKEEGSQIYIPIKQICLIILEF